MRLRPRRADLLPNPDALEVDILSCAGLVATGPGAQCHTGRFRQRFPAGDNRRRSGHRVHPCIRVGGLVKLAMDCSGGHRGILIAVGAEERTGKSEVEACRDISTQ